MATNKTTKTTDTLGERGKWMMIGKLPIYARPLTLLQIQEIGEEMHEITTDDINDYQYSPQYVLSHPEQVKAMNSVIVKSLFRKPLKRLLFGNYVINHLTMEKFKEAYSNIHASFDFDFFIQGLIFLKGTDTMKKMENQTETAKKENPKPKEEKVVIIK